MSLFFQADLPVIKTSCNACRVKDYQTGTAKADSARKAGKVMDEGQLACYSQAYPKLSLLAVFLLLFLSSCQIISPANFPLLPLVYFLSCYINRFYCASVTLQNDLQGIEKQIRTNVVVSTFGYVRFLSSKSFLLFFQAVLIGSSRSPFLFVCFCFVPNQ